MFFFQNISLSTWLIFIAVVVGLMLLNEFGRYSKITGTISFVIVPIILTIFVWPRTSGPGTGVQTANWFQWVKTYSALAGCIIFMTLRYFKKVQAKKWFYLLVPGILAINILEAVIREIEIVNLSGVIDGMTYLGGNWNYLNAAAGILNMLTICGWFGIIISKNKQKDMIWPDMCWFWIIAYDIWNFAYVYNCVTDRALYSGLGLLLAATIPAFTIKKGAWLQHRAQTLAFWMMIVMTFPNILSTGQHAIQSSHNPTAYYTISIISLLANLAVAIYQIRIIIKKHKNPLKDELYCELETYKKIKEENTKVCVK